MLPNRDDETEDSAVHVSEPMTEVMARLLEDSGKTPEEIGVLIDPKEIPELSKNSRTSRFARTS